ncbi:MAG: hypothetical protein M3R61_01470 [Chloroflexota bacterium]|nr:hypothetical protein [Chloroflexota bacterium]
MIATTSISFHPAQPCCTLKNAAGTRCGTMAAAGTLEPIVGGNFILQPFCEDCTQALLRVDDPPGELFPPAAESAADRHAIRAIGMIKKTRARACED